MIKQLSLIITTFFYLHIGFGQNLIPNSGFENCRKLGEKWIFTREEFEVSIKNWSCPNDGSPDILLDMAIPNMRPVRQNLNLNNYLPNTGRIMLGIKTWGCEQNYLHCKEYIQIGLRQPLLEGEKYFFSVYLRHVSNSVQSFDLGFVLSDTVVNKTEGEHLYDLNSYELDNQPGGNDTTSWQQYTYRFTAENPARFFLFGNFKADTLCVANSSSAKTPYTYWLIDDISLVVQKEIKEKILFKLPDLGFNFDEAQLTEKGKEMLNKIAQQIKEENIDYPLLVKGHTDSIGSKAYNENLSLKRAETVALFLKEAGVLNNMKTIGMGSSGPIVDNSTEENRALNRRVEIVVSQ